MATMILGIYTFSHNPSEMTVLKAHRIIHAAETVGGVEFFSFGVFNAGQKVFVKWKYCPVAVWNQLVSLESDDDSKVFTPGDGHTYNVQIMGLNGEYFVDTASSAVWRKNVELVLVVESQVS